MKFLFSLAAAVGLATGCIGCDVHVADTPDKVIVTPPSKPDVIVTPPSKPDVIVTPPAKSD